MNQYYSSGDVAKECNITVRTVQYYDKQGLISPSHYTSGGRRQYAEKDLIQLKRICLYRSIGFSIEEIQDIMLNQNTQIVIDYINDHLMRIEQEVIMYKEKQEKLTLLLENIESSKELSIDNIDDLNQLIQKKKAHKKKSYLTIIFLVIYTLFILFGAFFAQRAGEQFQLLFGIVVIVLLAGLIFWNIRLNAYRCPKCRHVFSIRFLTDLFSPNGFKGKYLRCPECKKLSWCKTTYKTNQS